MHTSFPAQHNLPPRPPAQVVAHASETLNVVNTCVGSELLKSMLPHLLEQLELCQKSLSAYLETKRSEFPRFYFVSDPTLLEILSLGSDPPSVVPHFQSGLFDSLSNVTFDKAGCCCSLWQAGGRVSLAVLVLLLSFPPVFCLPGSMCFLPRPLQKLASTRNCAWSDALPPPQSAPPPRAPFSRWTRPRCSRCSAGRGSGSGLSSPWRQRATSRSGSSGWSTSCRTP